MLYLYIALKGGFETKKDEIKSIKTKKYKKMQNKKKYAEKY